MVAFLIIKAFHGATTAGVEQNFSVYARVLSKERAHAGLAVHEGMLRMALMDPTKKICKHAQAIWGQRHAGARRFGTRLASQRGKKEKTEAAWRNGTKAQIRHLSTLRKRRSHAEVLASAGSAGAAQWKPEHDEQVNALADVSKRARIDASRHNHLLEEEKDDNLSAEVLQADLKDQKNDREHDNKTRKIAENALRLPHNLQGAKVYVGLADRAVMQDVVRSMQTQQMQPARASEAQYLLLDSMVMKTSAPWIFAVLLGRLQRGLSDFKRHQGHRDVIQRWDLQQAEDCYQRVSAARASRSGS